jgi:hypothetical protein
VHESKKHESTKGATIVLSHPGGDPAGTDLEPDPHGLLYTGDLQALRRADTVCIRAQDGLGSIRATLSADDGLRIYTASQQRAFPDAAGYRRHRLITVDAGIAGFDTTGRWHEHDLPAAATLVIEHAALHDVWQTVTAFLHVGDVLQLRFRADSGHDPLTGTCLHRDELHLLVGRGRHQFTFLTEVTVRPAETRMVTPGR